MPRLSPLHLVALFFFFAFILFLGMSRAPNLYDEGIILTGAMRVAAGQVPHRDFYAIYGPAQFYIVAGLFRLFGESLLVERLYDIFLKAALLTSVFALVRSFAGRTFAVYASVLTLLWMFGLTALSGGAVIPVAMLNLCCGVLLLPVLIRPVSAPRLVLAGMLAGASSLFRYDTGIALLALQLVIFVTAVALRPTAPSSRLRALLSLLLPALLGFALIMLPFALAFLPVATGRNSLQGTLFTIENYRRTRYLPFPRLTLKTLDNLALYLPPPIIALALYLASARIVRPPAASSSNPEPAASHPVTRAFLLTFSVLALLMYFKSLVRIHILQSYLCLLPLTIVITVLLARRAFFSQAFRVLALSLAALFTLSAIWASLHELKDLRVYHRFVLESSPSPTLQADTPWCATPSPLTTGLCFLPEPDRIRTIRFLTDHTTPGQKLYVGLAHHDRSFANDNLIYFAAQRLPATQWSHFDPGIQNSLQIQTQMIQEFDRDPPPYIVLDSAFESAREPNESAQSSGVFLLDNYLHSLYHPVQTFGVLTILQRNAVKPQSSTP